MDFSEDDASNKVDELFKKCQGLHRAAYPASSIDFDELNLTLRVEQSRFAVGRGHYSDVYKGQLDGTILVGVKILRLPVYSTYQKRLYESVILRFFRELNYWHELDHLNVARLLGFTLAHGNIGFVSPWYPNGNLAEHLQKQPKASRPDLVLDVAEGTQYLHTCPEPLLHGDLKAVNVLIAENGIACLGDFGISKQINDLNRQTGFSTTSGIAGTTPWMAPELLTGESVALASDVYAFAGVLLETYCPGKFPYHYIPQEADIILAKHRGDLLDPVQYPELDQQDALWDLINSCMTFDPQARPTINTIVQRLYKHWSLSPRLNSTILHRPHLGDALNHIEGRSDLKDSTSTLVEGMTQSTEKPDLPTTSLGNLVLEGQGVVQCFVKDLIREQESYLQSLDLVDRFYMQPLRKNSPPIIFPEELQGFMEAIFGDILDLRELDRKFLKALSDYGAERPSRPARKLGEILVQTIDAFRGCYPNYIGRIVDSKHRLQEESRANRELRLFLETTSSKHVSINPLGLEELLVLPQQHLLSIQHHTQALLSSLGQEIDGYAEVKRAVSALKGLFKLRDLIVWQGSKSCRNIDWVSLLDDEVIESISIQERRRQAAIFEFIVSETMYVQDLNTIKTLFIDRLKSAIPPIIPRARLQKFLLDVVYNIQDIARHHQLLLESLHRLQRDQHPLLHSIAKLVLDAISRWHHVYVEYISHFPIADYIFKQEKSDNPDFRKFVEAVQRDVELGTRKLELNYFLMIPLRRLPRVALLFGEIHRQTPPEHEDSVLIPQLSNRIQAIEQESESQVRPSLLKVELWKYRKTLEVPKEYEQFVPRLDLMNEKRSLLHYGWLCVQSMEKSRSFLSIRSTRTESWHDALVLLFDHYLVVTKEQRSDDSAKYWVTSKPIPIEFIALGDFAVPPQERSDHQQRSSSSSRLEIANAWTHTFGSLSSASPSSEPVNNPNISNAIFLFTVKATGPEEPFTVCFGAASEQDRKTWMEAFNAAKTAHAHAL